MGVGGRKRSVWFLEKKFCSAQQSDRISSPKKNSHNNNNNNNNNNKNGSISFLNPYVDCLNVLQAEILLRLRRLEDVEGKEEEKKRLTDALMISINGVANGMKNTG